MYSSALLYKGHGIQCEKIVVGKKDTGKLKMRTNFWNLKCSQQKHAVTSQPVGQPDRMIMLLFHSKLIQLHRLSFWVIKQLIAWFVLLANSTAGKKLIDLKLNYLVNWGHTTVRFI